ncbi:4Fe-4S dicluster-binding protein [Marasmitruncus massiliensis]|uniref:4Fe-4S dicluster-binding protein n=1 Tax=Marasmitruncus massiliensis TaxID=1944642 RepID=UPI000C7B48E7|nr:4Fe-4S dicluster-binding protein [Marasmitruncus massiliensis]
MSVKTRKRAVVAQEECVACGCCVPVCPKGAIHIEKGMHAQIEQTLCVGCGKCKAVCPASVIQMAEGNG